MRAIPKGFLIAVLLSASTGFPIRVEADTLRDVVRSEAMVKVQEQTHKSRKKRDHNPELSSWTAGMEPKSNFAQLFATSKGASYLPGWLGTHLQGLRTAGLDYRRTRECAWANLVMIDRQRRNVFIDILVPHPTYYTMIDFKTLQAFNQFEPDDLNILHKEELMFSKNPATLYRTKDQKCSLLIKIEKKGLVNLRVKNCNHTNAMMDIAKNLDLDRLNRKLTS